MKRGPFFYLMSASAFAVIAAAEQDAGAEEATEFVCPTDDKPSRRSYRDRADAKAIYRCAFVIPKKCVASQKFKERITLSFDITVSGAPENISVIRSTNECMNEQAVNTLSLWRYELLEEPEIGAEVTFKVYSHSTNYRNQTIIRDISRPG